MKLTRAITIMTVILAFAATAAADWDPGDGHKMHFPQLPDETGWDVDMDEPAPYPPQPLADDFNCRETGPITGIHIWTSVEGGDINGPHWANHIALRIREDIPASTSPTGYSIPGNVLWYRDVPRGEYETVEILSEQREGWWDPINGRVVADDHSRYWLYNFAIPESEAYTQTRDTIYWLEVAYVSELNQPVPTGPTGWKTSQDHWQDVAVYWDPTNAEWLRLFDPETSDRLDLAFVITPEPATMSLLALGGLGVLLRRRKNQG